jgi:hypothetical protein
MKRQERGEQAEIRIGAHLQAKSDVADRRIPGGDNGVTGSCSPFALDSPLEGAGFEPSVPLVRPVLLRTGTAPAE